MSKAAMLTPLSLAVPPSAMLDSCAQPEYDAERQYGVDHKTIWSTPMMAKTTQTFNSKGDPSDSDND